MNFLLTLIKAKWIFKKPNKRKVLIYDSMSIENGFAEIFFSGKNYEILDNRYKIINIYVFFVTLLTSGIKNFKNNYKKIFLKFVSPKIVYTSIDNNSSFFKLKYLYDKAIYISDQNGISKNNYAASKNFIIQKDFYWQCREYNKTTKNKLKADIIFLFGKNEKKKISPIIKGKIYTLGNTKNNHYFAEPKKINKKITSIMFICSGLYKASIKYEQLLFSHLNEFCNRKKIKLIFAEKNALGEIFYRNNFAKGNWIYFPRINQEKTYKNLNKQQMIVFTRTTLGYEGLAKGLKCAVFYPYFPEKSIHTIYPRSGPFWTNLQKYEDREKVLKRVIGFSNKSWKKIASKYSADIMNYDPNNIKKKKIIKMALKF